MDGTDITHLPPHEIVEAGIALVPEDRGIFADLTVQENLLLGAHPKRARSREGENMARVLALFPRLAERRRQFVRTMSGGERQMVAIGRAMMSAPSILMLDEPSLGLAPIVIDRLFETLEQLRADGVTILLVEQNAARTLELADRVYVLQTGAVEHSGTPAELEHDRRFERAYLGLA
jgi:branched-chain amino acid transport system ATP-binding protein